MRFSILGPVRGIKALTLYSWDIELGAIVGRNDEHLKEPQGELISMQLPQTSIVAIQLSMGSVGWFCFLTYLVLASRTVALMTVPEFFSDSKHVAYCEYITFCFRVK